MLIASPAFPSPFSSQRFPELTTVFLKIKILVFIVFSLRVRVNYSTTIPLPKGRKLIKKLV